MTGSRPVAADQRLHELLAAADALVAEPLPAMMEEFGLNSDQALSWQRTVATLAALIRREREIDHPDRCSTRRRRPEPWVRRRGLPPAATTRAADS